MSTPSLPEPRNIPDHLRTQFLTWRSERTSAPRRFGDCNTLKGLHTAADAVAEATKAAATAWQDGSAAWWRAQGDTTRPNDGRLVLGATLLRKRLDPARKALEKAQEDAAAALKDTRARLDAKLKTPDATTAALDAELRAHLRGLSHEERGHLVRSDARFAAAVARAPAALSGAMDKLHAESTTTYLGAEAQDDMLAMIDLSNAETVARESLAALRGLPHEIGCHFDKADALAAASEAAAVA